MKHILLIEDNPDVRENTAEILELAGYRVTTASNGKEGVEEALNDRPDLIVCDIMMPVLDGYGVLHLLSKNDSTADIPFIFLSAKAERSDMRKGMEMGADDYITKPFDDIELLNAVESRLRRADRLRKDIVPTREGISELLRDIHGIEDIATISQRQQVRQVHRKEMIYSEGDSPAGLYLLTKGKAKVYKSHELGKDLIIRMLHEGDFFGYLALLEGGVHRESAEAIEDAEVVIFPREDFFTLIEHSPQVMQQMIRLLSGDIADEQERLLMLAYSSVRKRTAEALLRLRTRYHDGSAKPFSMAIAREDLANMVGTATESLIRTLSDFREEGLVSVQGSTITLVDLPKLERMKN